MGCSPAEIHIHRDQQCSKIRADGEVQSLEEQALQLQAPGCKIMLEGLQNAGMKGAEVCKETWRCLCAEMPKMWLLEELAARMAASSGLAGSGYPPDMDICSQDAIFEDVRM